MTTGEKIAALRREHKLSQEALGEKLGLSRQAVSKWEADQAVPTMDNLMELSRLFGVPVDTLLRPDAPFPAAPAEDGAGKESEDTPAAPETPSAPRQPRRSKAVLIGGAALLSMGKGGRVLRVNVVSRTAIVSITAAAAHAAMYALRRYPSGFTGDFFS